MNDGINKDTIEIAAIAILLALLFMVGLIALTSGCVSLAKKEYHIIMDEPTPTPTPTMEVTEQITPTPTPEIKMPYDLWKYSAKQYNLSEHYVITRRDVSGTQDMIINTTVYRVMQLPNYYTWEWNWGGATDGSADWANVPEQGNKFVFVWICEYVEGENPNEGVKVWGMDENHVELELDGKMYQNQNVKTDLSSPIREFENLYDLSSTVRTEPFATKRIQKKGTGEISIEEQAWIYPGRSNAWDGWVLFEVPKTADITRARIHMSFAALGKGAYWTVTPMDGY